MQWRSGGMAKENANDGGRGGSTRRQMGSYWPRMGAHSPDDLMRQRQGSRWAAHRPQRRCGPNPRLTPPHSPTPPIPRASTHQRPRHMRRHAGGRASRGRAMSSSRVPRSTDGKTSLSPGSLPLLTFTSSDLQPPALAHGPLEARLQRSPKAVMAATAGPP